QFSHRLGAHLPHELAAMDLHGSLTDPDFSGDLFIEQARNYQGQNLSLPGCQRFQAFSQNSNFCLSLPSVTIPLQPDLNRVQQILIAERLRQELDSPRLHRSHGHRDIAVGSNEDNWNRDVGLCQLPLKIEPAKARQPDVENQTTRHIPTPAAQEFLSRLEQLDLQTHGFNQALDRAANRWLVIDDKNDGRRF